ncbi:MAG: hypothetical protein NZZ41_06990 [Candidatus Dojkabacteria bacterium]|nr:hypothetical protein [Candidatus Dojkabacteria bacterium]
MNVNITITPSNRIFVIGLGNVGSACAFSLLHNNSKPIELVISDINTNLLKSQLLDLINSIELNSNSIVRIGNLNEIIDGDIVVLTLGSNAIQQGKTTRLDLFNKNYNMMKDIFHQIKILNKTIFLILVTNPVDVLTYFAVKDTKLPKNLVFGTGTYLDSIRLKIFLSDYLSVKYTDIHGYVIGEHGEFAVPLLSSVKINNLNIQEYISQNNLQINLENLYTQSKQFVTSYAYRIIENKGYTNFGIARVVNILCNAILNNQDLIAPLSVVLDNLYCDLYTNVLSIPVLLNSQGWKSVKLNFNLSDIEINAIQETIKILNKITDFGYISPI